jgi:hypothetical protein
MKSIMMAAALAALGGCATMGTPDEAPRPVETITYATSPCFGACPVYRVTVTSDGTGTFDGKRFTGVTGERRFTVTPAQFADFRNRLQPYRPPSGERRIAPGEDACGPTITDQPGASVNWSGGGAAAAGLSLYYGCGAPALAAMKAALRAAPDALPIGAFVAKH